MSQAQPGPLRLLETAELQARVRVTLDSLAAREGELLLLRAEGYSYREIADAMQLNESSIGTLLARAKRAFREAYKE
jgi:RNA polymerase sigma-70 factor (ECF subfamily)